MKMWCQTLLLVPILFLISFLQLVTSARILGVFPIPSISHQVIFQPIWKELSLRGHQVTVLTPNPLKDKSLKNLTEIDFGYTYEIIERANIAQSLSKENSLFSMIISIFDLFNQFVIEMFNHSDVQKLIQNPEENFDLVIVETHMPLVYAFVSRFRAPVIGVSSLGLFLHTHDTVGNPTHPLISPDILLNFIDEMDVWDKLYSTFYNVWYRLLYHFYILPKNDKIAKQYFGDDSPYLGELENNVSLILVNTNPILHPIRPNVPAIIGMEQMHIKQKKPLPSDLQQYLDRSTQGVIYFSLGSNVKSANLSVNVRQTIISALSELPYNVLWKWESDHLPDQPKNVKISKWLPQQDVLGHKNVKAFLTQGGLQSLEEAIANGVPLIGMPFFGDQPLNVQKMVKLGIAKSIDFVSMTKEQLRDTILEVAKDVKFKNKIEELKCLLNDQPMKSLDRVIWWIEYVIRHKGAKHLKSPATDLRWYQFYLLDALGVVALLVFGFIFFLWKMCKWGSISEHKIKMN